MEEIKNLLAREYLETRVQFDSRVKEQGSICYFYMPQGIRGPQCDIYI